MESVKELFAIAGGLLILFSTVPYIIDIVRGITKPNIITWLVWSVLIGIGAAALFAEGQPHAAYLLAGDFVATFAVVLFGLKYGIAKLDMFDMFCLAGALLGLVLWLVFNSPIVAIVATITIDLIGTIPTLRHSWSHPEEETAITFAMGTVASLLTIFSLQQYSVSAWIYPVYLLLSNALLFITITHGRRINYSKK